ncbi:hypothetical protein [Parashewanella tropica]|uniref:hypothetical protein n=1 Tax=Parashewanella tropica TaxID=2547970 RepID=UPI00105A471C|nr:hypothetical protein [Parashewanella tropica]
MKFLPLFLLLPFIAFANPIPDYLKGQPNEEYLKTLRKINDIFPQKSSLQQLVILSSPYGILDIHPTKFSSLEDRNQFANFNLGVMGSIVSDLEENVVSKLPELVLCHKTTCREHRLSIIKKAISSTQAIEGFFGNNSDIKIIQRLDDAVYRVNNAFFTPTMIMDFTPSDVAGFIPSAKAKHITDFSDQPYFSHSKQTKSLRNLMKQHSIIAIVKENNSLINVIFGGLSNNQWGFKIATAKRDQPKVGKTSSLGFKYDDVIKLSDAIYYYQTN